MVYLCLDNVGNCSSIAFCSIATPTDSSHSDGFDRHRGWIAGIWSFRKVRTTVNPLNPSEATHFVSEGIYKLSRNPMYVGLACCLVSWAIWLSYLLPWLGVLLFVAYMTRFQIIPEERVLRQKFGDEYQNYCLKVRRWL